MHKGWIAVITLLLILIIGVVVLVVVPAPNANAPTQETASITNLIDVDLPLKNQKVESPFLVTGRARGTFYFEASFPVTLKDANGAVLVQTYAQAQGDWMTEEFVPFTSSVTFPPQPAGSKGTLVLKNDNPSGDPERDIYLEIPVRF